MYCLGEEWIPYPEGVVKSKIGLLLPVEIVFSLEEASGKSINGKQKWVGYSAAILLFASAPPEVRSFFLRTVWGATIDDDFADLSRRVATGELQQELTSYLAAKGVDWSFGPATKPADDEQAAVFPGRVVSKRPRPSRAGIGHAGAGAALAKPHHAGRYPKPELP
jgi:hypothetical protein